MKFSLSANSAVASMWSTIFFPIIPALFQLAVIAFAIVVAFSLRAFNQHSWLNKFYWSFDVNKYISFQVLNTIACIWDLLFISALNEISLAGAFSTWY